MNKLNRLPSGYHQTYDPGYTRPVGFLDAYKSYWVNMFNFNDRTSRAGFWWVILVNTMCLIAFVVIMILNAVEISFLLESIGAVFGRQFPGAFPLIIYAIWGLANLSITVRRLHDIGKRWIWIFLLLIPYAGFIILIVFLAIPSVYPPKNQFGLLRQV
jgi:uncharacterized membrane protein YhaH (DUF805 family)